MIALLAAWRWLAGLPRILLVCILAALLIASGLWFTYHQGQQAGEVSVHRKALADSTKRVAATKAAVRVQWDTARKRATEETALADSGRVIRARLRESVTPLLDSLPDPVVRLIHADDAQLFRDSVTIGAHLKASELAVRHALASDALDTLRIEQTALGVEPEHHDSGKVEKVVAVVGTVVAVVKWGPKIIRWIRRR